VAVTADDQSDGGRQVKGERRGKRLPPGKNQVLALRQLGTDGVIHLV